MYVFTLQEGNPMMMKLNDDLVRFPRSMAGNIYVYLLF